MITRAQKVKLVVFLLATSAIGLLLLVLFTRQRLFQSTEDYHVRVPGNVSGIQQGSPVAVRGVRVGAVERIALFADDQESVRLTLAIEAGVPIHEGARATLAFRGVTGMKSVDIEGGSGEGRLPPGSYIPYQASMLEQVGDNAEELMAQATELMSSANELVKQLTALSRSVDVTRVDVTLASAQRAFQQLGAAGDELRGLVHDSRPPLQRTLSSADTALQGAGALTGDAREAVQHLADGVQEVRSLIRQNESQLRATTENLRDATESFKYLARELRQRPSRLLVGNPPPERELP